MDIIFSKEDASLTKLFRLVNDAAANHGDDGFEFPDIARWNGHIVPIEHHQIGVFSFLQGSDLILHVENVGVGTGVGDQGLLAADRLLFH